MKDRADIEQQNRAWSRRLSAKLGLPEDEKASPPGKHIKDFVEALLELQSLRGIYSGDATESLMEWRHHSYATTLAGLRGYDGDSASRRSAERFIWSGNPEAVRDWIADDDVERKLAFNLYFNPVEKWPLDLIREQIIQQEIVRWWPDQAKRLIAFVLLRNKIVSELDFDRLSNLSRPQLLKHVWDLGRSSALQVAEPARTESFTKSSAKSSRRLPNVTDQKFKKWLMMGKPWIRGAKVEGSEYISFLAALYSTGRRWPTAGGLKAPKPKDADWLDELLARAEDLAPLLRFEPAWPTTFVDDKCRVTISVIDAMLVGWVEIERFKTLVSVDTDSWEVKSRGTAGEREAAAGLVIGWYLDSCICLRKPGHPHFSPERGHGRAALDVSVGGVTYLPTARFHSDVRLTMQGSRAAPRAHRVRGHVRELSDTRSPSVVARNNAPWYIRRHLKRHETFVKSHSRGKQDKSHEMAVYLSKYSTLADVLGSL